MAALPVTVHALHTAEMEYHGKFGHTLGRIQHIALMNRIGLWYATYHLSIQNVAPTLPSLQDIKRCVQYLSSQPHIPIFYPSNYYDESNVIRLTCSGNQFEDNTTQNYLEFHQDADHAIILNIRWSVLVITHTLLGIAVFWKVHIQPSIASYLSISGVRCYSYLGHG